MKIVNGSKNAIIELKRISNRINSNKGLQIDSLVRNILNDIKLNGDKAVKKYTLKFDGFNPDPMKISSSELEKAWNETDRELQKSLIVAKDRIEKFHQEEKPKSFSIKGNLGDFVERRWSAVNKAGLYIPGGRAAYPSTVLMNAIPAQVAGVKEIIITSPGDKNGTINRTVLAAAYLTGIKTIFRIGGAQAIAAMAYGTEESKKVDVISGPGNVYVTTAKKLIYGSTGIDSLAGPSEILIIADKYANSAHLANDLLAQAEHDPFASSILLTTCPSLANEVKNEISLIAKNHPRKEVCLKSIYDWGLIAICEDLDSCIELSNEFSPEHLQIITSEPRKILPMIENAGAIFLGKWTPEAVGDYLAGPNHTLPTSGNARFCGSLGVETFMKNSSIIEFNKKSLKETSKDIINLANSEGLHSHANSIKIRLED